MVRRLYERIRARSPAMPPVLWLVAIPAAILPFAWFQALDTGALLRVPLVRDFTLGALLVAAEAALALLIETYRRQRRDATRLDAFTRKVLAILDTRDLAHTITREAGLLIDAHGVGIVLDGHGDVLVVSPASSGLFAGAGGRPVPTEGSLSGWCMRTGDATIANRVHSDPRAFETSASRDAEHVIAAPLEIGGVRFGTILAARAGQDARPFRDRDLRIWTRVAQTVAPALSNARLYKRALLRRQHLEELHAYAATLVGTLDLQQVFDGVTARAARMIGTEAASLVLSDGADIVYQSRFGPEMFPRGLRVLADHSLAGTVVRENRPIRVADTASDTRYTLRTPEIRTQALLAVPVRIDGVPLGSLAVLQYAARQFTDEEEELLQQFANLAASVVRTATAFEAVDRSHKRFLSLFRAMPEGALLIRRGGVIELANPAAEQLFRVSGGALTGTALTTFAPDAALQDWLFNWDRNATPRRGKLERGDREIREVEWRANRLAGDDERVICAVRDLTDELKQTAELRTLAAAVHAMRDGVALVDPGGTVRFVNKAAATILGYEAAAEIVGKQVGLIIPDSQIAAFAPLLTTIYADGWAGEGVARHRNGRAVPVQIAIAPIREDANAVGLVGVFVDLTERRSLEQRAAVSEKLATLGRLVAGAAHEINNPLTAVLANAQFALEETPDGHAAREPLSIIATEARRAGQIVKSMLSFARQRPVEQRSLDLRTVLDEVARLRRSYWQGLGIDASVEGDVAHVRGDADQLKQVLLNLVVNAEYALRGTAERRLRLAVSPHNGNCRIAVEDSGPGVPEPQRGQIFEPFFTTKPEGEGSGLGLSVSYGIVHEHGGQIWVEASPLGGARFVIELPAGAAPRVSAAHGVPVFVEAPAPAAPPRRVLLVDDEEPIRSAVERILRRYGHNVEVAPDGHAALRLLEAATYDVVLCDIRMPNGSGPELYDELQRRGIAHRSRFVVTTGDVADPDTQRFLGETGLPVLLKPFELTALLDVVKID